MLVRVVLAVRDVEVRLRFLKLLDQTDVLVDAVQDATRLWETVSRESFDVAVIGRALVTEPAVEMVASLRTLPDSPEVVVLCDREDAEERGALLGAGCLAVLHTGLSDDALDEALSVMLQRRTDQVSETLLPVPEPALGPRLSDFVSNSHAMQTFMAVVHRVVASDATLLILGETGVGKERLARAIHAESRRSPGPFVPVNCGALSETLLESELFGHEEGAFTGASRARRGWFELAHKGTIFLDEIGEMPKHLQVKLLNVLQTREVQRVGAESSVAIDVRVVAATNRDLEADVASNDFRRDLYYRLSVVSLTIPPLRERREDIPPLVEGLLDHFRTEIPYRVEAVTPEAMAALCAYEWPGNVRELINVIERATLLTTDDAISPEDLPEGVRGEYTSTSQLPSPEALEEELLRIPKAWLDMPLRESRETLLREFERAYLSALLEATRGRVGETAVRASIQPRSLYEKMKQLGLRKEDFRSTGQRS